MLTRITTMEEAGDFAVQILREGVSFHPDDDFNDYVFFKENRPCYTADDAALRNRLMDECFALCEKEGIEIYEFMLAITLKETGQLHG